MSMLGFDAIGRLSLGQLPQQTQAQPTLVGGQWASPVRKAGLSVAVVATTFVGFVPPPAPAKPVFSQFSQPLRKSTQQAPWNVCIAAPKQAAAVFSAFNQPLPRKARIEGRTLYEPQPPASAPFTGFAKFDQFLPKPKTTFLYSAFQAERLFIPPPDAHDLVFLGDQFRKRKRSDQIEEEIARKAKLRSDLELAIYGPEVVYQAPAATIADQAPTPPNVEELARVIVQARAAETETARRALEQDDEDILEMILRDLG